MPVSREAILDVKDTGKGSKTWEKRCVKIDGAFLTMLAVDKKTVLGKYPLSEITQNEVEEGTTRFAFAASGNSFRLKGKSKEDAEDWVAAIEKAQQDVENSRDGVNEADPDGEEEEDDEPAFSKEELLLRMKVRGLMANACGKKVDSIFAKLDKDRTGYIDFDSFIEAMRKTMKIRPADISDREIEDFYSTFEADENEEAISIEDLKEFVLNQDDPHDIVGSKASELHKTLAEQEEEKMNRMVAQSSMTIGKAKKLTDEVRENVRTKLKAGMVGCGGAEKFVDKIDKDGSGECEYDELVKSVRKMLPKSKITDEEILGLCEELDQDQSGSVSMEELVEFIGRDRGRAHRRSQQLDDSGKNADEILQEYKSPRRGSTGIRSKMDEMMARLRGRIKVITQGGKQELIDKFYVEADRNGDGQIDYKELQQVIRKQLKFSKFDFPDSQIRELFQVLDDSDQGEVSLDEFTQFISNPEYFGSQKSGKSSPSNRLEELYAGYEKKKQKMALLAKAREMEEMRKIEESKMKAKMQGAKKAYNIDRGGQHHLYEEAAERERALQERQKRYDDEKKRQLQASKMRNLPTRSASQPAHVRNTGTEAGRRLYSDWERRARDRQQARDAYELAEQERLAAPYRRPRSASQVSDRHQTLYEEAQLRKERLASKRVQMEQENAKVLLRESVPGTGVFSMSEEQKTAHLQHLEELHKQHAEKEKKRAVQVAEKQMKDAEEIAKLHAPKTTPRGEEGGRRPSWIVADARSPRGIHVHGNPEEKAKFEEEQRKALEAKLTKKPTPRKYKPLTTQTDTVLATIIKTIRFRCGYDGGTDSVWDAEHRALAEPLTAALKVYKDAQRNCEASEGFSALCNRSSQRLFQEHLLPEFEGFARCVEPDPIRQVEDRLEDLMVSAQKAQLALKEAIAGTYWPEPRECQLSLTLLLDGAPVEITSKLVNRIRETVAFEAGRIRPQQVEINPTGSPGTVHISIRARTDGPSANTICSNLTDSLLKAEDQNARDGFKAKLNSLSRSSNEVSIETATSPNVVGSVRAHPDGVPIALFAHDPGVKTIEKAEAKALVRYGPAEGPNRYRHLLDLARMLLVFSSCDMLQAGLDQILRRFEVVDVRNCFNRPGRLGDRYVEVLVIMHVDHGEERIPHVCEIRLEELCFHHARSNSAKHLRKVYNGFRQLYDRAGKDQEAILHLVSTALNNPPESHGLRVFRCHLAKRFGSTVCSWRRVLGGSRLLNFQKFRQVCQIMNCGEHTTEFWQGLDPTLAGCISLFDLDPEASSLLIRLRSRILALADVGTDREVDAGSLFARLSFLVRPVQPGHLEPQEFRVVAKPLGLTMEEADKSFVYLDYYGGNFHAPPATITVQDITWLNRLPLKRKNDGQLDGLLDLEAVTMSKLNEPNDNEALRHLTWARATSRHNKRGEILRWSVFKDGASDGTPRGSLTPGRQETNASDEDLLDDDDNSEEDDYIQPAAPRSPPKSPREPQPSPSSPASDPVSPDTEQSASPNMEDFLDEEEGDDQSEEDVAF